MTMTGPAVAPPLLDRLRWELSDSVVLARRNLAHIRQIPEKLLDVTLQPLMFVLLFAYVFGDVIHLPGGGSYRAYLLSGVAVQTVAFGMMGPGVSIATDLREGIVDRFRSLPMARSAYLLGHLIAELGAALLALAVLTGAGLIVGWRIESDVWHAAAGFGLLTLIILAMLWLGTLLGVAARSPDAVQGAVFLVVFPLSFLASTFVPLGGLHGVLRTVAAYNPITVFCTAVRTLFGNPTALPAHVPWPLVHPIACSALWCVVLLAIAVPSTLWLFGRRTSD
jgi:ABC-2 type transport system permease protein